MASSASVSMSSGSASPAVQAHQMEVDSVARTHQPSPALFVEQELIPPTSRLSRLPTAVPSSPTQAPASAASVAISAFLNNNNTYTSQDVHDFVNSSASRTPSTATRTFGHPSNLETSVSSPSQPLSQHVLTHPIRRPRTSNHIFQSSSDLAAHYGIPQVLPPAPRTTQYSQPIAHQTSPINDFQTLSANYLNMLSKKPAETTVAAPTTAPMMSALTQQELDAPVIPSAPAATFQDLGEFFDTSPTFSDQDLFDYLNTPLISEMDDFGTSPEETPYHEFLNTPLFTDDAMLTSPMMEWSGEDMPPLFGGIDYTAQEEVAVQAKAPQSTTATTTPFDNLYTISPETPAIHSFNEFPPTSVPSSTTSAKKTGRNATGIRKGITPDSLLDEDAPTQPRKYTTPSATSRKDLPAVFARKRSRSTAFGEEEDQLGGDDLPPNPTEKDLIEQKRRQNTVAARRSRKRKLEQFQTMEKERDEERKLKELWMGRADFLLRTLQNAGVHFTGFGEENQSLS